MNHLVAPLGGLEPFSHECEVCSSTKCTLGTANQKHANLIITLDFIKNSVETSNPLIIDGVYRRTTQSRNAHGTFQFQ